MKLWRILGMALILALGVCLLIAGPALALVEQRSLDELADESDVVILGEVTGIASYQDEAGIYTMVTLEVEQAIKGETGGEVEIRVPGGEVDGIGLWVEDAPIFQPGERAVVFLEETGATLQVCGWSQGKFTVEGDWVVERDQSLDSFIADIEGVAAAGLPEKLSLEPASVVLDFPLESRAVEPAIAEDYLSGWQTIMSDGFEGSFPGVWTVGSTTATDAYWGKDGYRHYSGSYSAFCAKNGTAGVNPPANYPNNMEAWMIYGPFDLMGASDAVLDYYLWLEAEYPNDGILVLASVDNYYYYYCEGWTGATSGWVPMECDLTSVDTLGDLCGESEVYIAFVFVSNSSITDYGAFIDNVVLQKLFPGGNEPVIVGISPSSAPAGTGNPDSRVTITGTDFGATQGTSGVQFWQRGSTYLPADIVSWSSTSIECEVPAGASSGDDINGVRVITGAGPSNDYAFDVTFSYGERKWLLTDPMNEKYVINENTADCTGELTAVLAAMQTWNDVDSADFYFEYGGTTTATTVSLDTPNGENEILWVDSDPGFGSGWIAVNLGWYNPSTGEITESDIVFNDYNFTWDTSGSPSASEMDVQNIATHELGHSLCLLDLYGDDDSDKTMYGYGTTGETYKRILHTTDEDGIQWIYPGAGSRGQYHVSVTNDDDDDLTVSFKADTDAGYTDYRRIDVPSGETRTSFLYVLTAINHQVSIQWTDPDKGTADELTSASLAVATEGDTEFSFTIPQYPSALAVTTGDATSVTETTATLNGNLDNMSGETSVDVSFEWGTTPGNLDQETTPETVYATGPFTADLSTLTANTIYYFRAKAVGSVTVYGQELSFITDITPPTMEAIGEAEDEYYNTAPTFANFGFDDNVALDDGWYQLDAYTGDWTALFTDASGTAWDSDGWAIPDFGTLAEGDHTIYFQASDDAGNIEGESGEWSWQFHKDTVAPTGPTDVTSPSHTTSTWSTDDTVDITWTTATDATSGLDGYSILWDNSADTIPDQNKDIEEDIESTTSLALADGNSHYFHISSVDNIGNWQTPVHLGPFYIDTTAPEAVTDLAAGSPTITSLTLTWTAPGDGVANSAYDIRYSTDLITDANWDSATQCTGEPAPATPGSAETFTVLGLIEGTPYYFALKTSDELSRWSELSNVPSGTPANSPPVLSDGQVAPASGYTSATFNYSVVYTDGDNDAPEWIHVIIDEDTENPIAMEGLDAEDTDYTDGKTYQYSLSGGDLGVGTGHTFQFAAYDGTYDALGDTGVHTGPTVRRKPSGGGGGGAVDTTPPRITEVTVTDITETSAYIHWKTQEVSSSLVEFWSDGQVLSVLDEERVVGHHIQLTGLTPGTTYHFLVKSTDSTDNVGVSEEYTFTTEGVAPAAVFDLSDLTASPAEIDIGDTVTISVLVANTGNAEGTYHLVLKLDGTTASTKAITLAGGASQTVTFTTSRDSAGSCEVSIDGLACSFVVRAPAEPTPEVQYIPSQVTPPPTEETNWRLIGGIIVAAVCVAAGLLAFFLIRRRRAA